MMVMSQAKNRSAAHVIMQGQLEDYPLSELLQFLATLGKRVHLLLERLHPHAAGGIYIQAGQVIHAYCPPDNGEEAFYALLSWEVGRFLVIDNATSDTHTIQCELRTLLLEGMRRLDETETRVISRLQPDTIPLPRETFSEGDDHLVFSLRAWRVLAAVDGRRSLSQIAHIVGRPISEIERIAQELAGQNLLRLPRKGK
jgi:Domain of unknown function (DUF4388)